ncbi:uncharacterized protein LOC107428455 [Ziziphus jujuba]|uniref:mRNA guanylyltransferase n=1 Tax=Ziziphus jujuba TaxID=326968 RepID=A0A6P4AYP2_ZIZJJ|nr:uncharacterized protein LOC107428455 [Ziziphus jujuba]
MIVAMDLNGSPILQPKEERRRRLKRDRDHESQPREHHVFDKSSKLALPPGWLDCPAFGEEICYMVPSKVPLSEAYNDRIPPGGRYSFKQVHHHQRVLGRTLGLVIDLTNTKRYYPTQDLNKDGIKHVKIPCKGRDSVPDNSSVNHFVYEVSKFIPCRQNHKYGILVHCTHGHNRTGYMIVHFLMRTRSISLTEAIGVFAQARPPGIYKKDYIDALYAFYHERKPQMSICPPTPQWKGSSSDLDNDNDDDGVPASPLCGTHDSDSNSVMMTNDDVLGDEIPWEQQDAFRKFCYQSLKLGVGARGNSASQFPGSHPVSLNSDNLQLLRQQYYYATWKADGTRYMMLITIDGCYLIDRNFNFRRAHMRFPLADQKSHHHHNHHYTLLDGEMVIDTLPDSHKQERRYLIYDMMVVNNVSVIERPFHERWMMLEKQVIVPRRNERVKLRDSCYRYELEPFRVRRKDFWLLTTVNKLLKEFIPRKLSHDADGLIFQGWDDPYVPRTHQGLLKWKYAKMNSVDFLFQIGDDDDRHHLLFLYERGKKKLMEGNYKVEFKGGLDPSSYAGKIIECCLDFEKQKWEFMRVRTDKSTPNDFNTYKKVMRSIKDNITEDFLLDEIKQIINLPMYHHRIQIDKKANFA